MEIKLTDDMRTYLQTHTNFIRPTANLVRSKYCVAEGKHFLFTSTMYSWLQRGGKCDNCSNIADSLIISNGPSKIKKGSIGYNATPAHNNARFQQIGDRVLCSGCAPKSNNIKWTKHTHQAEYKNDQLVDDLIDKRETLCGMGTRKTKLKLNKMIKSGSVNALILRNLLELEDANITAKRYHGVYKQASYDKKNELLKTCIDLFKRHNLKCGYHNVDNYSCPYVIYFEVNGIQMSWHAHKSFGTPQYMHVWDGLVNSTLSKLEQLISHEIAVA